MRVLAQELRISPTTVHKAVLELRDGGFLASRPGAGMVVVKHAGASRDQLIDQLAPARLAFAGARSRPAEIAVNDWLSS